MANDKPGLYVDVLGVGGPPGRCLCGDKQLFGDVIVDGADRHSKESCTKSVKLKLPRLPAPPPLPTGVDVASFAGVEFPGGAVVANGGERGHVMYGHRDACMRCEMTGEEIAATKVLGQVCEGFVDPARWIARVIAEQSREKQARAGCACGLYPSMRGARETPPNGSVHERQVCKNVHGEPLDVRHDFSKHPQCSDCLNAGWSAGRVGARPCARCPYGDKVRDARESSNDQWPTESGERLTALAEKYHQTRMDGETDEQLRRRLWFMRCPLHLLGVVKAAPITFASLMSEFTGMADMAAKPRKEFNDVVFGVSWECSACKRMTSDAPNPDHACAACREERESTPVETAMIFCALPWCGREHEARVKERRGNVTIYEAETIHCSDRCREYDERRGKHEATRIAFLTRLKRAYAPDGTVLPWALEEMRWAQAQYEREVEPIRLQFLALRVDP